MTDSVDKNGRLIRNPDVVTRDEDEDGAIMFNPDTDQIKIVNPTGLFIWNCCDGSKTQADIIASIFESYSEIPDEEMSSQVHDFLRELLEAGFIGRLEEM